jgi:hypothetical protein
MQLIDRVEEQYTSTGKPLHVVDPDHSLIHVMSYQQFYSTPVEEIQSLHARHHLLVTGLPQEDFGFDEAGLLSLAPPEKSISIQGTFVACSKLSSLRLCRSIYCSWRGSNPEIQVWDDS